MILMVYQCGLNLESSKNQIKLLIVNHDCRVNLLSNKLLSRTKNQTWSSTYDNFKMITISESDWWLKVINNNKFGSK